MTDHLTNHEQERYLLDERTPRLMHHLAECSACQQSVARLEQTLGMLRAVAVEYSASSLGRRPQMHLSTGDRRGLVLAPQWALAVVLPLLLLVLALLPMRNAHHPVAVRIAAPVSDDALLDQVDDQLSVTVPSSMESLTHLVTARGLQGARNAARGSAVVE